MLISSYYETHSVAKAVADGRHRDIIGGLWEELGRLQLEFLIQHGLKPHMRLLDIGCGCLRAGVKLVAFLEPGKYYGIDMNRELVDAGYQVELAQAGLQGRLPRSNLVVDAEFDFSKFQQIFDVAIAQSLFTHLPLNHIRLCLRRLAPKLVDGGVLFATFFQCPEEEDVTAPRTHFPGEITTFTAKDPYHYKFSDLEYCARNSPWQLTLIGDWTHPRGQMMCQFTKV